MDGPEIRNEISDYHHTILREIRDNRRQDEESISDEDAINEFGEGGIEEANSIDDGVIDYDEADDYDEYPMDIN